MGVSDFPSQVILSSPLVHVDSGRWWSEEMSKDGSPRYVSWGPTDSRHSRRGPVPSVAGPQTDSSTKSRESGPESRHRERGRPDLVLTTTGFRVPQSRTFPGAEPHRVLEASRKCGRQNEGVVDPVRSTTPVATLTLFVPGVSYHPLCVHVFGPTSHDTTPARLLLTRCGRTTPLL